MKLNFFFKHLDHSKSVELYTQEKLSKTLFYLLKESDGKVCFSKKNQDFIVSVTLATKQKYFKAEANHFDIYSAVDEVAEKLERQLLKVRQINKQHKKVSLTKEAKLESLNPRFELKVKYRKAA